MPGDALSHPQPLSRHWTWRFEAEELRTQDPIELVMAEVHALLGTGSASARFHTVLAELFANALEHGVLELDSEIKHGPFGYERYYEEHQNRLDALKDAWIEIDLDSQPAEGGGRLTLEIRDSGKGFELDDRHATMPDLDRLSGRGLPMVYEICESLVYHPPGNRAVAVVRWVNGGADKSGLASG